MSLILGVETSCDESSAAVVRDGKEILSHIILSQDIHRVYGGVVPELASREHIRTIVPVVRQAMDEAGISKQDLDGVAATVGPGLIGSLVVGLSTARSYAWALGIPFLPIHHLEAHLYAVKLACPDKPFRFVALIVSGGHTELVEVRGEGRYRLLGETRDDAAGEAFDKVAKMAGLPYPGGPAVDKLAAKGDPSRYPFTRARLEKDSLDFSFSGIKTAVRYAIRDDPGLLSDENKPHLLASFQNSVVGVLTENARRAFRRSDTGQLALCGGVAANTRLRASFEEMAAGEGVPLLVPPPVLCTDNAAMVAAAGESAFAAARFAPRNQGAFADLPLPFEKKSINA